MKEFFEVQLNFGLSFCCLLQRFSPYLPDIELKRADFSTLNGVRIELWLRASLFHFLRK